MKLIVGNKNYSSWSLRAWLFLAINDILFDEESIALSTENTRSEIAKHTSAGKVPVLHDNDLYCMGFSRSLSENALLPKLFGIPKK